LFAKNLTVPILLHKTEALERRIKPNHEKMPIIKAKIKALKSGYNGEKVINYHLSQIPSQKYLIFHDLRLPLGNSFFQIDALLLSPKFILTIDGKNHSGKLTIEKNQMIQEYLDTREVYENPVSQVNRHKILLKYWLTQYQIPSIPIESLVVITKTSTEVKISQGYKEAEEKICKASDLLKKIEDIEKYFTKKSIDQKTIEKVRDLFLTKHTPKNSNVLKMFGIHEFEILTGVHCPRCLFLPMSYRRNNWICPSCQFISRDAHLKALNDYFLIINTTITNPEIRRFLHLPSPRVATNILSQLNFPYKGVKRGRVYLQPYPP
jgi:hypothetical protein